MSESEKYISADQLSEVTRTNLTSAVYEKLQSSVVAVAGLGGLGSVVASSLARAGVGRLIIADFDIVEASNLNRQQYFADQLGKSKVDATQENLLRMNPYINIEKHQVKLDPDSIVKLFADADIIVECFDKPDQKQMIAETVLTRFSDKVVVSASGMAGFGDSNSIQTRKLNPRWVMVGDYTTAIEPGLGLFAARVGIAANHQANAVLEMLINELK